MFVTTYVWIKSKVLDIGPWNFYHLFLVILSILLGIEGTLTKKITTKFFFYILGYFYLFFYFIFNFSLSYVNLFSIAKNLLHAVRNKIKKEPWKLVKKQKSYSKSKNVKKMPKKLNIFSLKILKDAGIFIKPQNRSKYRY